MGRLICCASLLAVVSTLCLAQSYDESLLKMRSKAEALRTYHCTFVSFARGKEKADSVTFDYYFKKPASIRMEARRGPIAGAVLLYTGTDVRVKPGRGVLSWFSFSYPPENKKVCDARGNSVPMSSWAWYIDVHLRMKPQIRSRFAGYDTVDGKQVLKFELTSADPSKTRSIASEQLWIDPRQSILLQYRQYDEEGTLIQSGLYRDIQIDSELSDRLFTEFAK